MNANRKSINYAVILALLLLSCDSNFSFNTFSGKEKIALPANCVLIFINVDCPICQKYQGDFKSMNFDSSPVYYVFPGKQDKQMIKEMCLYDSINYDFVIIDSSFKLTKYLKATVSPQAIIRHNSQIVYQGLIDDRFTSIGTSKPFASINYIENALNSLHKNEAIKIPYTKAVGCFIEPN